MWLDDVRSNKIPQCHRSDEGHYDEVSSFSLSQKVRDMISYTNSSLTSAYCFFEGGKENIFNVWKRQDQKDTFSTLKKTKKKRQVTSSCHKSRHTFSPIYLYLNFEIFSLTNLIFGLVSTGFLQATQAVKIQFKLEKKSSSTNLIFQAGDFKNQVQINREYVTD